MQQPSLPIRHSVRPSDWRPDTPPCLDGIDTVYLDAETNGLRWFAGDRPVGWAITAGEHSAYLPFGHRGGGNLDEAVVKEWARRELRGKHIVNLKTSFDLHMSRAWGVDLAEQGNTFEDVSHSAALLDDHRKTFSLDALSHECLGEGKLDSGPKGEIADMPAWDIAPYAIRDTVLVKRLKAAYAPRLAAEDLLRVQALENSVLPVVVEMEHNGCPIDVERLHRWLAQSEAALDQMLWDISRAVGFQVNPDKNEHLERVFKQRRIENPHRTASGAMSFTAAFMKTVTDPVVQDIYRAGKLMDLRSKFLVPYGKLVHEGYLYCTFHQLMTGEGGTVSGRFSSARPNLQQVMKPEKQQTDYGAFTFTWPDATDGDPNAYMDCQETFIIKELFREHDGAPWFCADQEQVEFRIFGHYANSRRIIDTYNAPPPWDFVMEKGKKVWISGPHADFHHVVTNMIRTKKAGFPRGQAKNANFAKVYGSGVKKFAMMIGALESEAVEVLAIYDAEFPEAGRLLRQAMRIAETRGHVHTLLGRRSRFPRKERTHKALNAVVQGSAADINKLCLAEVYKERKRLGLTMRLTVHDELNGRLEDAAMLPAVMEVLNTQYVPLKVPILWDGHVAASWAEAK